MTKIKGYFCKKGLRQLKADIRSICFPLLIIAAYWVAAQLIFGAVCPMVIFCGYPCPACGLTRACLAILTGHFAAAATYNVTAYLWIPVIVWLMVKHYMGDHRKIHWEPVVIIMALVTIGYYIYRMLRVFPGNEPMIFFEKNIVTWILDSSKMK